MKRHASVQELHIQIDRIEDDVIFFTGSAARAVVEVSGVGFAHQGADEQGALVAGFAAFLNSLTFPLQIVLRAVPIDVAQLASDLDSRIQRLPSTLAELGRDHSLFLRKLARERTLLDRHCYVIIPAVDDAQTVRSRRLFHQQARATTPDAVQWQLLDHCEEVSRGLGRCGLTVRRLGSAELLHLFAACWCPAHAYPQVLSQALRHTTTPVVHSPRAKERNVRWPN